MAAHWVIDGEKTFITSGMRADWITVAVRTGGQGAAGISLLAVPGDAPGLERTPLAKMGWWCSDTAQLRFADCRVPADHLIGEENAGFRAIMDNFNGERLLMSAGACAFAAGLLRRGARLGAPAQDLRPAAGRAPGRPPQAGRHAHARRSARAPGCEALVDAPDAGAPAANGSPSSAC